VYGGPISVKGAGLTIKAFSSVPGGRDSSVVTGFIAFQTEALLSDVGS
jgi:hypothetical protein